MHDELGVHFGDEAELALADARGVVAVEVGRPEGAGFLGEQADVLGAFFHFTGEVESGRYDEVWVCVANLDTRVEAFDVDLCCGHPLLADAETLA